MPRHHERTPHYREMTPHYREMTEEEAPAALALVLRVFDEFVRPDFSGEGAAEFERAARELILRRPAGHRVSVADDDGGIVGVIDVRDGEHVALFFVEAARQRTGIGRGLLRHALELARPDLPEPATVTVNSSPWAVPAYERLGFRAIGPERELNGIRFMPMERVRRFAPVDRAGRFVPTEPVSGTVGAWLWLFPAVFAAHIAEECLAGERFYRWIRRTAGREIDPGPFVVANLALELAMIGAVRRATRRADAAWVVPTLGLVTATNGLGHLAGSIATRSYSPGAVSGAGLWAPLGVVALLSSRRTLPPRVWRRGVALGLLVDGAVVLLGSSLSHKPRESS